MNCTKCNRDCRPIKTTWKCTHCAETFTCDAQEWKDLVKKLEDKNFELMAKIERLGTRHDRFVKEVEDYRKRRAQRWGYMADYPTEGSETRAGGAIKNT